MGNRLSVAVLIGAVGTAVLLPPASRADASLTPCVEIADDAARLACYDRVAGRATAAPVTSAPAAAASATAAPAAAASATAAPATAAPATAAPATTVVPPATAASGNDPVAEFGLSQQAIKQRDPEGWVDSISGTVRGVTQNASGRYVVELDNGQVWAQAETDAYPVLKAGDAISIRRAAVGSFVLTGPRSVAWRVRRLR